MRRYSGICSLAFVPLIAIACSGADVPEPEATVPAPQADFAPTATHYKPVASTIDLMRGLITLSAEVYWQSVSVVVDEEGIHENMPQTDEDWIEVWAAGMALAESGNLLMMPPRALDEDQWIVYSTALVDAGFAAAQAAMARDFEGVLAEGEAIYNTCVACHRDYVPRLPDL